MNLDFRPENCITLAIARRKFLPRPNDKLVSPATSYRYVTRGILAADGSRVRLPAVKFGRSIVTTPEAVAWFLDELVRRTGDKPPSPAATLPTIVDARLRAERLRRNEVPTSTDSIEDQSNSRDEQGN